jgi:hypothetical protein
MLLPLSLKPVYLASATVETTLFGRMIARAAVLRHEIGVARKWPMT